MQHIQTKAVHAGDRKRTGNYVPVTTPICLGSSFLYEETATLDKVFAHEVAGYAYQRYDNPTNAALEEALTALEGGQGTLATASGMAAVQVGLMVALMDRRRVILAANALYGATIRMLMSVFEPQGVEVRFIDVCDLKAVEAALAEHKPGCLLLETISNPLLRVPALDRIAELTQQHGTQLVVDSTFATPLLVRPLELGANIVIHSLTKFLNGHGDVLAGAVTTDAANYGPLRAYSRTCGPTLGPFEAYMTMRGLKTFPLRMERQCQNACKVAQFLQQHPGVDRVYYTGDPTHPDADTINRLIPGSLKGAMVSFEVKGAQTRQDIFTFMDRLQLVVKGTSLGDVHTLMLYPVIASHRDLSPKQRERMGIRDNLVRLSVGIEAAEDIIADLSQALG